MLPQGAVWCVLSMLERSKIMLLAAGCPPSGHFTGADAAMFVLPVLFALLFFAFLAWLAFRK
jgi:hypothetical protein